MAALDVDSGAPRAGDRARDSVASATAGRRGLTLAAAFTAAFAVGGWKIGLQKLHDNSFLVHLTTGRWILDHGIPHRDVYSYTAPGTRFIAQSWLAELVYGLLERSVGAIGIQLLMGVCATVVMVVLYRIALRCCGHRLRAAGITLPAFAVVAAMWSERPLAFGLVALVALVVIVELPESWLGRHQVFAMPVVMWLWLNVHGSFALGYLYVALHLVGRALDGAPPRRGTQERSLLVATAVSVPFLFVNPYGLSLVTFPVELLGRGKVLRDVVEWMSPDFHANAGMAFAAFLTVAIVVMVRTHNRPSRRDVLVALPFLLLGFWALRNLAIATVLMVPIVARAARVEPASQRTTDGGPDRFAGWVVAGLVGLALAFAVQTIQQPSYDLRGFSVQAVRALAHARPLDRTRIFTTDANAGWLLAAHFPQSHVFMDDRYDMYPLNVIADYEKVAQASPQWSSTLDKYKVDAVVWPRTRPLAQLLAESPEWTRLYRDKSWVVFVRQPSARPVRPLDGGVNFNSP
jgi:hypothetical protein